MRLSLFCSSTYASGFKYETWLPAQFVWRVGLLLLGLLAAGTAAPLHAQTPDSLRQTDAQHLYRIETTDGNTLVGTLVSETEETVVLQTKELDRVSIKRTDIEQMTALDGNQIRADGTYRFRNPQSTRYFFAPNALGLPKGTGYYRNTWVLFNDASYGITDHVSVGGGTVPLFLFGADIMPVWVLPKVSAPVPGAPLHVAGGGVIGGVAAGDEFETLGLLYGSATVGTRNHNATLGVGYGYANGSLSNVPVINVSGMTRLTNTLYVVSENYVFPAEETGLMSVGMRWAPENFAVDFGLFRPLSTETDDLLFLPWLGVTIPFGR